MTTNDFRCIWNMHSLHRLIHSMCVCAHSTSAFAYKSVAASTKRFDFFWIKAMFTILKCMWLGFFLLQNFQSDDCNKLHRKGAKKADEEKKNSAKEIDV